MATYTHPTLVHHLFLSFSALPLSSVDVVLATRKMATCQKPKETKQTGGIFIILARAQEKKNGYKRVYIFILFFFFNFFF
jgi:hypothetical protein